ncbi:MAG TPA: class I SAM-dependent methyltransferase [Chthoniobacterales bacterium]|nr:class I SAM-dependent methyltransferase [Chthoniobacterales bacterium]
MVTLRDLAEGYNGESFAKAEVCPICSGHSKILHGAHNIHPEKQFRFDLRSCGRCYHAWIDPMPSQGLLDYLYERVSPSVVGPWLSDDPTVPERLILERESQRPPGRYFELGVGQGHLYREFLRKRWVCIGVDPGPWGRALPNVSPNFNNIEGDLQAELLVAFDVLEHVADPVGMLRRLRRLSARGATFYCAMPNCRSLRARVQRERWRMIRPMGHVNYWSQWSIVHALNEAGFELSWIKASDLWTETRIRRARDIIKSAIERFGLGDQWIASAIAS